MKIKKEAKDIFHEYEEGQAYKNSLFDNGLYEQVKLNENFYNGRQWEGVEAPNLDKPVFNFLKRVTSWFVSNIVSDDISVSMEFFDDNEQNQLVTKILQKQVDKVIEHTKLKKLMRQAVRNECVDGDMAMWFYYDLNDSGEYDGQIRCELIDNTNIYFGNPYSSDIQKQPYIIFSQRMFVGKVKDMAKENGVSDDLIDSISSDSDYMQANEDLGNSHLTTVLTKLWKENGKVHSIKVTNHIILEEEKATDLTMYPIAYCSWEPVKNSCHGISPITAVIPNQILVNKIYAMCSLFIQNMAFPRVMYDKSRIQALTKDFSQVIAVPGIDGQGAFNGLIEATKAVDFSNQIMPFLEQVMSNTKELMGASDTALGDVNPDNTSAIIAVSEASAMPLEIQKLGFHDFVEDCMRIILDIMACYYGTREVLIDVDGQPTYESFAFDQLHGINYKLNVDVGTAAYWSELTQQQTLDNLFTAKIISDPIDYLEAIPAKNLKGKDVLIQKLKAERERQMQQQNQTSMPQIPQLTEEDIMNSLNPEQQAFVQQNPQVLQDALNQNRM